MLFAPKSIIQARQALYEQMEAGTLTREQAFQQALELDPFDAVALIVLGEERYKAGDLAGTADYCWRAVTADPCHFEPWFKLFGCLPGESEAFRNGLMELGASKALRDPEGIEHFKETFKNTPLTEGFADGEEFLEVTAEVFREKRRDEPEDVSERLRPYRLIDDLLETADDGLEAELVDGILEDGARCVPLLVGVLRAMATGSLPGNNQLPVICSLALLGEIGDPAALPELIECYALHDEVVRAAAIWAVKRIVRRRPEASFEIIRKLAPASDAEGRCDLAMAVGYVPDQPGKRDFLLSLLHGMEAFPKADRHELFMSVALALDYSEGAKGRELAWSLFSRHSAMLPKRTRAALRDAFKIHDEMDRAAPGVKEPEETVYELCALPFGEEGHDVDEVEDDEDPDDNPFDDEEDQDEDFIPEPVRRSVNLGRNDPCWCGSGKKYKKCHLESDEKSRPAPPSHKETPLVQHTAGEAELRKRLLDFTAGALRKREMEEALLTYIGTDLPAGTEDNSLSHEALDWVVHDYVPPRLGRPLIEEFLKRSPGGLSMRQRKTLEGWSRARFSLFEVQEVREGSGVRVKDLLAGGEFFVDDVSTSKWAVLWDCLLARIEELDSRHIFTAIVLTVPKHAVAPLKEWAIGAHRRSGLDWDAFLHANSHKLRQEYSRLFNRPAESTRVVSFEGDELVFSRTRYEVLDEDAVRRALDESKAFVGEGDPAEYGWLDEAEDATGGRRAYGHVRIAAGELTLECSTRQRLERGKALLRSLAGKHLRHRDDDFTSWQSAMRDREASPDAPEPPGLPPEVERELLGKVLAEHYDRWLDMPLPALDGKTPRAAVATPEGRAQVVDVLKILENGEQHKRREGLAWYDVSKLKAELGVEF
jgi:hypothetical protein